MPRKMLFCTTVATSVRNGYEVGRSLCQTGLQLPGKFSSRELFRKFRRVRYTRLRTSFVGHFDGMTKVRALIGSHNRSG